MFVLDASLALTWLLPDERSRVDVLARMEREGAIVPPNWCLEMAEALVNAQRKGRIDRPSRERAHALLAALPIATAEIGLAHSMAAVSDLALRHDLSVYDAGYLELAVRHGLPLATVDMKLGRAARESGVEWIGD